MDAVGFICSADDMHPYNCGGLHGEDGIAPCVHCNREVTPRHSPDTCIFCRDASDPDADSEETL